jgi:hypothetical protein
MQIDCNLKIAKLALILLVSEVAKITVGTSLDVEIY